MQHAVICELEVLVLAGRGISTAGHVKRREEVSSGTH